MASSHPINGLSRQMEKMSVNGKRHADAPRYMPPHRKYAQATKGSETSTPPPTNDSVKEPASTLSEASSIEKLAAPKDMSTGSKSMKETEISPTTTQERPEPEPKSKTTSRSMPPHKKYSNTPTTKAPAKDPEVADSWEEEEEEEEEAATSDKDDKDDNTTQTSTKPASTPTPTPTPSDRPSSPAATVPKSSYIPPHLKHRSAAPSPPSRSLTPPTSTPPSSRPLSRPSSSTSTTSSSERRPEKTNAVAHRLIAGALGVKVPRRTEEQRAYDKAIREQEKKKRDVEREAKKKAEEDAIKAKAAIWED